MALSYCAVTNPLFPDVGGADCCLYASLGQALSTAFKSIKLYADGFMRRGTHCPRRE
jgi:hypothetical protein